MASETTGPAKQNAARVTRLVHALRQERAVIDEGIDVDRNGLMLTLRVRVGVTDLGPENTSILCGFLLDKLMTAYGEIEHLRSAKKEEGQ